MMHWNRTLFSRKSSERMVISFVEPVMSYSTSPFRALSDREMKTIIDAFESVKIHQGDTLIRQGDIGDFFYIMRNGKVRFELNGNLVGYATKGKSFGELALLYTSPRAASVIAETPTTVYRVDQKTFRYIMQSQTLQAEGDKKNLLQGIAFLQDLDASDLNKLVHTMTPRKFEEGEYIVVKGEEGDTFYVIQEGQISVKNITIGSRDYEDQVLGPGDYFGERALLAKEPRSADCVAKTDGIALTIDKETFEKVVGKLAMLMVKAEDRRKLVSFSGPTPHLSCECMIYLITSKQCFYFYTGCFANISNIEDIATNPCSTRQ